MSETGTVIQAKVRGAAAAVLSREVTALAAAGDLRLHGSAEEIGLVLAEGLERVGLLSLTGETAIALELVSAGWPPVGGDLAAASLHGIHLGGIMQSGEEDHVADYLRVTEAQHDRSAPRSLDEYRPLARRLRVAYREAVPAADETP